MSDTRTTVTILRDASGAYGLLAAVATEQGKHALAKSYANLSRKAEARAAHIEALMADAERECGGLTVDPRAFDKRIGMLEMNLAPRVDPPSATPEASTARPVAEVKCHVCGCYACMQTPYCPRRAPAASPRDTSRPAAPTKQNYEYATACDLRCAGGPCYPACVKAGDPHPPVCPCGALSCVQRAKAAAAAPTGGQKACKPCCGTGGGGCPLTCFGIEAGHWCSMGCFRAGRPLNPAGAPEGESR